jgi:hypothetical protein
LKYLFVSFILLLTHGSSVMGEFLRSPVHASSLRDRASLAQGIGHICRM